MGTLALLQLVLGLGGGMAQSLIGGRNGDKIGQISGQVGSLLGQVDVILQKEAALRGIPVEQLTTTLIAELDKAIPQTGVNIQGRIDRIKNS